MRRSTATWLRMAGLLLAIFTITILAACTGPDAGSGLGAAGLAQLQREPINSVPWQWGEIPGSAITTAHYKLYTTIQDPTYQRLISKVLEAAYAQFERTNPGASLPGPYDAFVFADRSQWELYTKLRTDHDADTYLQITAGGFCRLGVFAGYDIGREGTLSVIAHEAWHQLCWFAFKDHLPSWLDEGFATQNENIEWDGITPTFVPERNYRRFFALQSALRENRLWTIDELTATHAGKVIRLSQKHVDAYYAQVWSLVLFLEHSKYRANLQDVLQRGRAGRLALALDGTGISRADYSERWNQVAGPLYLRKFIAGDPKKLQEEYLEFIHALTEKWPPRVPDTN